MLIATKCLKQGVAVNDVYQTIQAFMGGLFVNYFNEFGRTWQFISRPKRLTGRIRKILGSSYVRNTQGQNVPLSALANFETRYGPEFTLRYNEYRSAAIHRQRRARL